MRIKNIALILLFSPLITAPINQKAIPSAQQSDLSFALERLIQEVKPTLNQVENITNNLTKTDESSMPLKETLEKTSALLILLQAILSKIEKFLKNNEKLHLSALISITGGTGLILFYTSFKHLLNLNKNHSEKPDKIIKKSRYILPTIGATVGATLTGLSLYYFYLQNKV